VGKARNLKNRLANYLHSERLDARITLMITQTAKVEILSTASEHEALILESDLIKKLKPKYNIIFRDDKSYPYILLTEEAFPKLLKHRGAKKIKGEYFGPFASGLAVNETIEFFTKLFQIRTCSDQTFAHRSRPCLLYQIKRCSAPCVKKISVNDYLKYIEMVRDFMQGKREHILHILQKQMAQASQEMNYEQAATIRDRIASFNLLKDTAFTTNEKQNVDVVAIYQKEKTVAIQLLFFRSGIPAGSDTKFINNTENLNEVLESFLSQFYTNHFVPDEIMLSQNIEDESFLEQALNSKITVPKMGPKKELVARAVENARLALERYVAQNASDKNLFFNLKQLLHLPHLPERIEVFDNSHTQGTNAVGAMIVATPNGFDKKSYRKFNVPPGSDDLALMNEVLERRYTKAKEENILPNLIMLDGGKTQLGVAMQVLEKLHLHIPLVAISKGVDRNAGNEELHLPSGETIKLAHEDKLLFLLQKMRDEAHRFVITTHRKKREKSALRSEFDEILGIGPFKKKSLLNHFATLQNIKNASPQELSEVPGINEKLAQKIYDFFH